MLIDTIKADQLQARKDRYKDTIALLTTFYSEAAMIGKNDGGRVTTDAEVIALVKKFIKNAEERRDNLDESDARYVNDGFEINVLSQYLPTQMSDDELKDFIGEVIGTHGLQSPKDMGVIMKELKATKAGLYDGGKASQLAKALLAGF